jgi:hypothetical protein
MPQSDSCKLSMYNLLHTHCYNDIHFYKHGLENIKVGRIFFTAIISHQLGFKYISVHSLIMVYEGRIMSQ